MIENPFLEELDLSELDEEINIRLCRQSYLEYVKYTNQGYKESKFHRYLCENVQKFMETDNSDSFDILLLSVPPQFGKGHPINTPILTTTGWKKFGDLVIGDYVFSDEGKPVMVTGVQEPYVHNIVNVLFDTGETVKCSPEHLWKYTRSRKCRKFIKEIIVDEAQNIFKKYNAKSPAVVISKAIENNNPVKPDIDPYTYGLWLGDGYSGQYRMCGHYEDVQTYIDNIPYKTIKQKRKENTDVLRIIFPEKAKRYITKTKKICDDFLLWSKEDRLELLKGLMDTDGTVDKRKGSCEYCTINKDFAFQVLQLIRSLGFKGRLLTGKASINGVFKSLKYRVCFTASKTDVLFKLERKQKRLTNKKTKDREDKYKLFIKSITPAEQELHRCIQVEGGMYLIGETLIPTHNSTSVTETLPAWFLGKHPDKKVIICGYNEDFAIRFGRRNKEKIEEFNPKIFPDCVLADAPRSNVEFETTKKGRCISRGILSGLTGNTADLFIIDDPVKNRQEADSETTRSTIWNEYMNSVKTRIKPHGKLIVIQTRWHEEDLYGMLAKTQKDVTIINIPCECDDPENDPLGRKLGDSLCPEIGRGNAWLQSFKEGYVGKEGSRAWTALYQGKPVAMEGNLLKREWWKFYDGNYKDLQLPYVIISVDAAFKDGDDNDFVAIQVWGKRDKNYYLLDAIKKHLNFVDTLAAIRNFKSQYEETIFILIEDKANGTAIINVLSSEMEGVIPIKPEGGKVTRANAVSPTIESGHVYLPRFASFVDDFIAECSAFPNSAHDDQVDAMTQALNRMIFVDADVVAPKSVKYTEWMDFQFEDYENANDELKIELLKIWGMPLQWYDD